MNMLFAEDLEAHLRVALEILREHGDPVEDRTLLCVWLWLKHVNDEFEDRRRTILQEETAAGRSAAQASAVADDRDEYRFFLPAEAKWQRLAEGEGQRAEMLAQACAALENRYPDLLGGVLAQMRFTFPSGAPQQARVENLCRRLWEHFDKIDLSQRNLFSADTISSVSAQVIAELAGNSLRKKTDFASPAPLMHLLADLVQPQPGMRICDPTCGVGGGLIACAQYLEQRGHNPQNLSLYGQEIDAAAWTLCKLNLLLHDLPDHRILQGNALTAPLLAGDGELQRFDLVLAHLPFSVAHWGYSAAEQDPWQRFTAGLPPVKRGDLAFVLHAWAALRENGRTALVVPQGVLFRGGVEGQIRRALLQPEADAIEAVISLPPGWLYDPKLPSAILILNRAKAADRRGHVLFIEAGDFAGELSQKPGSLEQALAIAAIFHGGGSREKLAEYVTEELERSRAAVESRRLRLQEIWRQEKPGQAFAESEAHERMRELDSASALLRQWLSSDATPSRCHALVSLREIAENKHHYLTPAHYCLEHRAGLELDLARELQTLQTLAAACRQAEADMDRLLHEMGYLA